MTYHIESFDEVSNAGYHKRPKCSCCFKFCMLLTVIEILFSICSSFILGKEFIDHGRHTDIKGSDLLVAYLIRDEDINISIGSNVTVINVTVNGTVDEPFDEPAENISEVVLLSDESMMDPVDDTIDDQPSDDDQPTDPDDFLQTTVKYSSPMLLSVQGDIASVILDKVNSTAREFINDILNDIKNSTELLHKNKTYYVTSMEFTYLSLALYCSNVIFILMLIVGVVYLFINYIC